MFNSHIERIPSRITIEQMSREMGIASNYMVAEFILNNKSLTIGFDGTTRAGKHINSIHITSSSQCVFVAVDYLSDGT